MSYRVLVIPEDFRKDQYVLEPIPTKMIANAGRKGKVLVCRDPLLGGVEQALRWERIAEVLDRYRAMIECFLLIVDRDGKPGRRTALDSLEQRAAAESSTRRRAPALAVPPGSTRLDAALDPRRLTCPFIPR
jgi:hypothetical protein